MTSKGIAAVKDPSRLFVPLARPEESKSVSQTCKATVVGCGNGSSFIVDFAISSFVLFIDSWGKKSACHLA
jgi:hypothetical protein